MRRVKYEFILRRDGYMCQVGGPLHGDELHVDHIWPRALGGDNSLTNLWTLCAACNLQKSDRHPMSWLETVFAPDPPPLARLHRPDSRFWLQLADAFAHAEFDGKWELYTVTNWDTAGVES